MKITIQFLLLAATLLIACGGDSSNLNDNTSEEVNTQQEEGAIGVETVPPPSTAEPAQNTTGIWHYICPKGCEGGSGTVIQCPICSSNYIHNTAYHTNKTPDADGKVPPPEPAKNAFGVWHYVCSSNCGGGAGGPGTCPDCGALLAHNPAYH